MKNHLWMGCALFIGLAVGQHRLAMAGWTGQMNGAGFGKAGVNVTSRTSISGAAATPTMKDPSAAMVATPGYFVGAPLPSGASAATVARIKGLPGYIWSAATSATGGDKTDNPEIESRMTITPALSASITVDSTAEIGVDGRVGTIRVNALATAGTAMLLRGYEFLDGEPEDLEDLKENGILKWEILLAGPFDLRDDGPDHCNSLVIPFSLQTDTNNLYFVSDGVAVSRQNDPPVPSATITLLASGVIATLSATDDHTLVQNIKIWIKDFNTPSFKAGPFKAGDKIILRKNALQSPFSRVPSPPYTAQVQTKGQALLVAEDDEGGITDPGVPVP